MHPPVFGFLFSGQAVGSQTFLLDRMKIALKDMLDDGKLTGEDIATLASAEASPAVQVLVRVAGYALARLRDQNENRLTFDDTDLERDGRAVNGQIKGVRALQDWLGEAKEIAKGVQT